MRIAVITDDGRTVAQHFSLAPRYVVVTVEGKEVLDMHLREKPVHVPSRLKIQGEPVTGERRGLRPADHYRHQDMIDPIHDCQVLLAGGMGRGVYYSLQAAGIRPVLTDILSLEEAVSAYLTGTLVECLDRLHS